MILNWSEFFPIDTKPVVTVAPLARRPLTSRAHAQPPTHVQQDTYTYKVWEGGYKTGREGMRERSESESEAAIGSARPRGLDAATWYLDRRHRQNEERPLWLSSSVSCERGAETYT